MRAGDLFEPEALARVDEPNSALPDVRQIAATIEHSSLDESKDAGSQDAVSSLEVWLHWRPNPLHRRLAKDPRSLLPAGFGEGEQLLVKEGDRRGSKSVGVDNPQRSVLGSEPAPQAASARRTVGAIQRRPGPRSSENPAFRRAHWALGRPSVRICSLPFHRCGQPDGEFSHIPCLP